MPKKITRETTLKEILELPGAEEILAKYNLPCLGCPMAAFEMDELKIGHISKMYGLDLKKVLKEFNDKINDKSTENSSR